MTLAEAPAGTGTIGFLVIVALGVASYLLFRSMSNRLRNVQRNSEHWPTDEGAPPSAGGDGDGSTR